MSQGPTIRDARRRPHRHYANRSANTVCENTKRALLNERGLLTAEDLVINNVYSQVVFPLNLVTATHHDQYTC